MYDLTFVLNLRLFDKNCLLKVIFAYYCTNFPLFTSCCTFKLIAQTFFRLHGRGQDFNHSWATSITNKNLTIITMTSNCITPEKTMP